MRSTPNICIQHTHTHTLFEPHNTVPGNGSSPPNIVLVVAALNWSFVTFDIIAVGLWAAPVVVVAAAAATAASEANKDGLGTGAFRSLDSPMEFEKVSAADVVVVGVVAKDAVVTITCVCEPPEDGRLAAMVWVAVVMADATALIVAACVEVIGGGDA